jgi:hypothetical protein
VPESTIVLIKGDVTLRDIIGQIKRIENSIILNVDCMKTQLVLGKEVI